LQDKAFADPFLHNPLGHWYLPERIALDAGKESAYHQRKVEFRRLEA